MIEYTDNEYAVIEPTVMFRDDYRKLRAHVHDTTKNRYALRMVKVLRSMGIKNNLFHLALFDKGLADIDPFDYSNITKDIAERIFLECRRNHWYYFREICRIAETGGDGVPFEFHRGNMALIWCYYNDIDIGLVMPRQHGKTIGTQAIIGHQMYFQAYRYTIPMLTKDHSLLVDNVDRLKQIKDNYPKYLLQESSKDRDAKEGVSYTSLKNTYKTFVNAKNSRDAYKLGRGCTAPSKHIDEIAYCTYIELSFPVMMSSSDRARLDAAKRGMRHADIYTTTAGRPDTPEGSFTYKLFNSGTTFNEIMYDCADREDLMRMVRANSSKQNNTLVFATFSHRQLGKTDKWLMETISRTNTSNPDDIDRDYLNIWKVGQGLSPIPSDLLKKIVEGKMEPVHIERIKDYLINWYNENWNSDVYKNDTPLIIGMDSSEMVGEDYSSLVAVNPFTLEIDFTSRCNDGDVIELARTIVTLLLRFPKSVFVPEVKSTGKSILDYVVSELEARGFNPWTRIYSKAIQEKDSEKFEGFNIYTESSKGLNRALFGFKTSGGTGFNSRFQLYRGTMLKALKLCPLGIRDESIITEFCNLTIKNDRYDHVDGGHDDMIISYLLACNFLFHGKFLSSYGLDPELFFTKIKKTESEKTEELTNNYINGLISRLKTIEDRLSSQISSLEKNILESEKVKIQRYLASFKKDTETPIISSSQFTEKLKDVSGKKGVSISTIDNYLRIIR